MVFGTWLTFNGFARFAILLFIFQVLFIFPAMASQEETVQAINGL